MGIEWQVTLTGVFVAGIIFMLLSLMKIREKIINIIPLDLKYAIASGIGFFITFIGLKNGGIIIGNPDTFVSIGDLTSPTTLLAIIGLDYYDRYVSTWNQWRHFLRNGHYNDYWDDCRINRCSFIDYWKYTEH